jgi:uncharacterized protein
VVGAGLAGLVAATEVAATGRHVLVVEQEPEQSLGGQAFWSLGGLFFVDSPEQRRLRVRDSIELATADWMNSAGFDRAEDHWPRQWALAYLDFAVGEKRAWLHALGMRWFPIVGWAERGFNSVPRFHITWGSGPGVLEPFLRRAREAQQAGLLRFAFRHRVDELVRSDGAVSGVRGTVLMASDVERGRQSSREGVGTFEFRSQCVVVSSGGIGGNAELVRKQWPPRLGPPPAHMICGVPDYVDGRMLTIAQANGGHWINSDRMWHYVEGIHNWDPIWSNHAIRILPGPSSLWLDATGQRLPPPFFPGFDTLGTLDYIMKTGFDYTWFILTQKIIKREFALSGSEQNPDLTNRDLRAVLRRARGSQATPPVEAFKRHGVDFIVRDTLPELVDGMNAIGSVQLDYAAIERVVRHRDNQLENPFGSDLQCAAIRNARAYWGDRAIRVAKPHRMLDPRNGPLIAVRLNILTRKSLGGLETDLSARVLGADGHAVPGLYAAGEAAGFGGGGVHGYRSLEGTFLGGCLFSGRSAGRAAAAAVL